MTTLDEALRGAFAAHESSERDRVRDVRRTIGAVRRRRAAYAAGTGSAAAVAVGALAFGGMQLPRWAGLLPSAPSPAVTCTADPYGLANTAAFGALTYLGASYLDTSADVHVFVAADGTRQELMRDDEGNYRAQVGSLSLVIWHTDQGATDGPVRQDWVQSGDFVIGTYPGYEWNSWAWTVDVPEGAPAGVDTVALSAVLLGAIGGPGSLMSEDAVPAGASVSLLVHEGSAVQTVPVRAEDEPAVLDYLDRATSVDVLVKLDDGTLYAITATHDPAGVAPATCVTADPSPSVTPSTRVSPSPDVPEVSAPLGGPEAQVFACGAALRPELQDALGWAVSKESGWAQVDWAPDASQQVDLGDVGVTAVGAVNLDAPSGPAVDSAGWSHFSLEGEYEGKGVEFYAAVVAVADGVITGYQVTPPQTSGATHGSGTSINEDGSVSVLSLIGHLGDTIEPCAGVEPEALDDADLVLLQGRGPIGGRYEFGWSTIAN